MADRVLVTGGAGYVGSHTVYTLIQGGYDVVILDNLETGHRSAVHPDAELIIGDLRDADFVNSVFERYDFDGIFHFASYIIVPESMEKPWKYLRDNFLAASNLLEAATAHGVQRFILSSTANLFNEPETMPIKETDPIIPGSVYGESKAMIERALYWMDKIYGMKYCALRYFNASGAHPNGIIGEAHDPETHLIPLVLQVALGQREKIFIFGDDYDTPDGTAIRDYIHVMDLAKAHVLAFEALAEGESRVYNIGTGTGYSVKEVIETARKITGHPIPAEKAARRAGDATILVADNTTLMEDLGWEPTYARLEQIIETAWTWHREHPNGYEEQ